MSSYLIGLDIGTSKLAAVALDAADGKLLASEQAPNRTVLPSADPDAAEQDAAALIEAALQILSALVRHPELAKAKPAALGITGQMHGLTLADGAGRPLSPLITWQDGRGNRAGKSSGHSWVHEFSRRVGAAALEASGCQPASGYGGVTLLRLAEEGALPKNALALTIQALFVRRLCGRAVLDPTDAASWGLFDVRDGAQWLPGIAEALGFPKTLLPEIAPTGSLAGKLLPEMAAATGLPAGLPVAVALGDNQASFLGSATRPAETVLMNLGTGGQMSVPTARFARVEDLETRPFIGGNWLLVGASLCGGRAYEILKNFFQQAGRDLFAADAGRDLYEILNRLAAGADADCGGISARTLFAGSRRDPSASGMVEGLTAANFTPANVARAVIRGMVAELAEFYELARLAGAEAKCLVGAGNAVRHNPVVWQELERRLKLELRLPPHTEEAAAGAALAAARAAGVQPA
jgi:sugar (pentulose or hexulose) kinase